jgi:hypothetical protein
MFAAIRRASSRVTSCTKRPASLFGRFFVMFMILRSQPTVFFNPSLGIRLGNKPTEVAWAVLWPRHFDPPEAGLLLWLALGCLPEGR